MAQAQGGQRVYKFTVKPVDKALTLLSDIPREKFAAITDTAFELPLSGDDAIGALNAKLVTGGVTVSGIAPVEKSLEEAFLQITSIGGGQIA